MSSYYVYILRCSDATLYTGLTTEPERRLAEHQAGGKKGARYTRCRLPVEQVWLSEPLPDRASAGALEWKIKRLTSAQKRALIAGRKI